MFLIKAKAEKQWWASSNITARGDLKNRNRIYYGKDIRVVENL